ncbi:hypothetical protein AAEU29_11120 [Pseudoalteromonas sp. SSM20]|uniref:hypothetical protein n=1 Tax=Pseudoalteromonas sp. SSM20 TaxID=3139394 RepID=UPI003BA99C50
MRNTIKSTLVLMAASITLVACGGTTTETLPNTEEPVLVTGTAAIEAPADFNFKVDLNKKLTLNSLPSEEGVVRIYSTYEFFDEKTGDYYPDPTTLLASFSPAETLSFDFQMLASQEYVVVEFAPSAPSGVNVYKKINITNNQEILVDL